MAKAEAKKVEVEAEGIEEGNGSNSYIVYTKEGDEYVKTSHEFKGRVPSQAARKAARHLGLKDFYLRQTGSKKLKHYAGGTKEVVTKNPTIAWMKKLAKPDNNGDLVYTATVGTAKHIPGVVTLNKL